MGEIRSEAGSVVCSHYSFQGLKSRSLFSSLFSTCNYVFSCNVSFKRQAESCFLSRHQGEVLHSCIYEQLHFPEG